MRILNLTQHAPTPEQVAEGVFDIEDRSEILRLLNFTTLPTGQEVKDRAARLADIAMELSAQAVMVGGAPFFMPALAEVIDARGIEVLFAYSERVSVETAQEDGSVTKTSVFKHVGFVRYTP